MLFIGSPELRGIKKTAEPWARERHRAERASHLGEMGDIWTTVRGTIRSASCCGKDRHVCTVVIGVRVPRCTQSVSATLVRSVDKRQRLGVFRCAEGVLC